MKLLVVIPCLNEEENICETIKDITNFAKDADIWVIDNCSTDNTAEFALNSGAKVIRCPQIGKGFAIRKAFSLIHDKYDAVFVVDGDATYSISELNSALDLIYNYGFDMVVGKRINSLKLKEERSKAYRFGHEYGNRLFSNLFKKLFNIELSDVFSGWRVMSIGFVKSFLGGDSGFEIEAELNSHAYTISAAVTEIPVKYYGRKPGSNSKLRTFKDGVRILKKQLLIFRNERPLVAFNLLAMPWFFIGLFFVVRAFIDFFKTGMVNKFPSLIVGVSFFVISSLLWVSGIMGERQRLSRIQLARYIYGESIKKF